MKGTLIQPHRNEYLIAYEEVLYFKGQGYLGTFLKLHPF